MVERLVSRLRLLPPLLILSLCSLSSSLHVVSSSPCRSVCATSSGVGTRTEDVVCLDSEYASTTNGTGFQDCVVCELESTAVDSSNGATDVGWGLYNLRYALSTCVFGFPQEKISTSTPCQVSCEPLRSAIGHNLNTNATLEDLSYCSLSSFQDTVGINRCAACYGRMDGEAYMANFLQALHIACLHPPRPSEPFPVTASTIFNATPIVTPTPSSTSVPSPRKSANLALIVTLPVVFGVIILGGIIACCFYSARHRRRIMAERNRMRRFHDKHSPTFPTHNQQDHMHVQTPQGFVPAPVPDPVYLSPILDRKDDPYILQQQPLSPQQPQRPQYPYHSTYTPADYAQHPTTSPVPFDTSKIGPGPDQQKVHTLHDQYFPPPPPAPMPPSQLAAMQMEPSVPQQQAVQPLQQHQLTTPSLALPIPRGKRSLDVNHRQRPGQGQHQMDPGVLYDSVQGTAIPLREYGTGGGDGNLRTEDDKVETPQVFVYDPVSDRYVKESPPQA